MTVGMLPSLLRLRAPAPRSRSLLRRCMTNSLPSARRFASSPHPHPKQPQPQTETSAISGQTAEVRAMGASSSGGVELGFCSARGHFGYDRRNDPPRTAEHRCCCWMPMLLAFLLSDQRVTCKVDGCRARQAGCLSCSSWVERRRPVSGTASTPSRSRSRPGAVPSPRRPVSPPPEQLRE